MNEEKYTEINLMDLFNVIKARIWWIIVTTIVIGAFVAAYSWVFLPDIYQADATVIISSQKNENDLNTVTYNDYNLGLKLVNSYRIIAKTEKVISQVIYQTSIDTTVAELSDNVIVESQDNTEIIKLSVQNTDPKTAQIVANAVVDIFQEEVKEIMKMDNVQVIDYAKMPTSPVKPNRPLNVVIGMFVGMVLAIVAAIVIDLLDTTISSPEQLDEVLGITTIGVVPYISSKKGKG